VAGRGRQQGCPDVILLAISEHPLGNKSDLLTPACRQRSSIILRSAFLPDTLLPKDGPFRR